MKERIAQSEWDDVADRDSGIQDDIVDDEVDNVVHMEKIYRLGLKYMLT